MLHRNNVSDNGNISKEIYTDNDNGREKSFVKARKVELIAQQLVDKFGSDKWREFYLKVAYKLPENIIWSNYELAIRSKKSPGGLFHHLCNRSMYERSKNYNIAN